MRRKPTHAKRGSASGDAVRRPICTMEQELDSYQPLYSLSQRGHLQCAIHSSHLSLHGSYSEQSVSPTRHPYQALTTLVWNSKRPLETHRIRVWKTLVLSCRVLSV